jgi:uncharacterized membrane protein
MSRGGHATLWDRGRFTDLNGDARGSRLLRLNDRGEALVLRDMADHQAVGLWRHGWFTTIATYPYPSVVLWHQLSARGHVAVLALTGSILGPPSNLRNTFWRDGTVTDLATGFFFSEVNDRGQLAGRVDLTPTPVERPGPWHPAVWEGGEVTVLPAEPGSELGYANHLNDRGQAAGQYDDPTGTVTTHVLWDGGEVVDIGAAVGGATTSIVELSKTGQVLVEGTTAEGTPYGAVWDGGEVTFLPAGDEPGGAVDVSLLNDRGQVVGYRLPPGTGSPGIPTLWELR